jgi:hypothetical protein
VRFREDKTEDLARARKSVHQWRQLNPQGNPEQLVTDLIAQFHPDYAVVLRAVLFTVDSDGAKISAGIRIEEIR